MRADDREAFIPLELHRRTPDEMLAYWAGKSVEWIAERNALTARAERAEVAIERARRLAEQWRDEELPGAEEILAALDSTDPVEAAPQPGPIERSRIQARAEVELVQRWWLRSGGNRWRMAGPKAAAAMKAKGIGSLTPDQLTVCWDFEFRPPSSRFFDAPPFPGTHPDVPAPGRSGEEKPDRWNTDGEIHGRDCLVWGDGHMTMPCTCGLESNRSDARISLGCDDCDDCDTRCACPGCTAPVDAEDGPDAS